jgi:hypothetical protein
LSVLALGMAVSVGASPANALPFFSIDFPSPTLIAFPPFTESDVFMGPGPVAGPPVFVLPAGALGLLGLGIDELDAMAVGTPGFLGALHFSVDRFSAGVPVFAPDVASEAAAGQQAGDIYVTGSILAPVRLALNALGYNQDILGEIPPFPPGVAAPPPIDDLDALHLDMAAVVPTFFSLALGHPYIGASGLFGCGGDLFVPIPAGPPGPALPFFALGLGFCADDVDALELDLVTGDFYFSLAPGSPSLAPAGPLGCPAVGCSPADIFVAPGAAGFGFVAAPAAALGLAFTDNLNALAANPCLGAIGADGDGDGVDDGCDNCILLPNPTQFDSDVDGYGNACDPDYDQSGVVLAPDFVTLSLAFGTVLGGPGYDPTCDHDESGGIFAPDFVTLAILYGGPPGPSALPCAGTVPCTH